MAQKKSGNQIPTAPPPEGKQGNQPQSLTGATYNRTQQTSNTNQPQPSYK